MLLEVADLNVHYGRIQALKGVSFHVSEGELVALVGANGAGKTTLLRSISGVQPVTSGKIRFRDRDLTHAPPERRVELGIAQVPEGRQVFAPMSVADNLRLGAYTRRDAGVGTDLRRMYEMFPRLRERATQAAGTLSGGEQQMLALSRALMSRPRLLLLDEPSMGLSPILVQEIFRSVVALKEAGTTILLVEQNAHASLSIADRGYVLETGSIVMEDRGAALLDNDKVKAAYLGI